MKYIVVDETNENCFIADSEEEILTGLGKYAWDLEDFSVYECGTPIDFELKIVRKSITTITRKEK